MIRIFLNGNLCSQPPQEFNTLEEELFISKELHGYIYQIEGSVTFEGADYDFLRALFDAEYCTDVTIDIQRNVDEGGLWESKFKGLIKLSDCHWKRLQRKVECNIVDNSFIAKINNNKSINFQIGRSGTLLSKNGVDIQYKFVSYSDVQLFSPFRGRYFNSESNYTKSSPPFSSGEGDDLVDLRPAGRNVILTYDALNVIIAMMTDDEVDFASDYFSYDLSDIMSTRPEAFSGIFSGKQLRFGTGYPTIAFVDFFDDLHKLCNVWFAMETGSNGKPVFRVENEDYFRQSNSNTYFNNVEDMVEFINLSKIYSKVQVGCSQSSSTDFPVGEVPLVMHNQEEFPLSGNCNLDNSLNLRLSKLIINTNSICRSLPPITGYANGGTAIRKYTNEEVTAGPHQKVTDTNADFQVGLIQPRFLIRNTRTNEWSYVDGVPDNDNITVFDEILTVDNTGLTKDYEVYKPSDDDSLDEEVFLIQLWRDLYDSLTTFAAYPVEIDPPGGLWYYNDVFSNANVITRHLGAVGQSIISSLSDGNDEFLAEMVTAASLNNTTYFPTVISDYYRRIRFDDDSTLPNFDTNGNYDATTGIYTAPQDGYYHAYASVRFSNSHLGGDDFNQQVEMQKVSASGDVLESETINTTITHTASFTFVLDRTFYLKQGERIEVWIKRPFGLAGIWLNQYIPFSEFAGGGSYGSGYGIVAGTGLTFFGVDELFNGGGLVPVGTPNEARILNVDSDLSIDRETFDNIRDNPYKYYHLNFGGSNYVSGYIDKIKRGILDGETQITLFKRKDGV